ncbi:DUF4937 domain-containing protein [Bacillus sp. RAR_GA_16]|uniref:DUF4937 domain-containing protein n=1 Tax=Bacillus sp. RAR_GA_16 TaxID=2876774 RepID=UPI001CCD1D12|nr:DUF4937 domain-containing protein [Bacillus sp. RAR_GA_16]MCA0173251.1 YdbC family protein [Bacillus sp. RAR_GA_16]
MLIKKVVCHVKEEMRETFSSGQERWSGLYDCKGFVAQYGGWSDENIAMIIGFWKNRQSYARFMNEHHDTIYLKTNQRECIKSIEVQVEEMNVTEINTFAAKWLNEQNSEINRKWTIAHKNLQEGL